MIKVTEATIQAVLMVWAMNERHHTYVLPNSNGFFHWESDLITVTQAGLCHEYEVKLNRADYNRDAEKRKHRWIGDPANAPAYFWYVTHGFEIVPPEKAGWILVRLETHTWRVDIKKQAPRLNAWKLSEQKQIEIGRLLSWRMTNFYKRNFMKLEGQNGAGEEDRLYKTARAILDYYETAGESAFRYRFGTLDVLDVCRQIIREGEGQPHPWK